LLNILAIRPLSIKSCAGRRERFVGRTMRCMRGAIVRTTVSQSRTSTMQLTADIAADVLRLLTARVDGKLVLLPAAAGFENVGKLTINPSYYVFPMFPALAALVPSTDWADLQRSGLALIEQGRFGRWHLPPDWLQMNRASGALAPAPGWPPLCSYDAIRVPLYLIWAGLSSPAIAAFAAFYAPRAGAPPPAWVNLETEAEAPYPAPAGMLAVARIADAAGTSSPQPIELPTVADAPDYYSAALTLLARIAWQQRGAI
jgi:endo-1,4-beta-D-glucanase Y